MTDPVPSARHSVRLTTAGQGAALVTCLLLGLAWGVGGAAIPAAALSLALIVAAPLVVWLQTKDLYVLPAAPVTAFAGDRFTLEIPLVNGSRRHGARDLFLSHHGSRLRTTGFCGSIDAERVSVVEIEHPPLHRGRLRSHRLQVATSFPFGLARAELAFDVPVNVLVLPRLGGLRRIDQLASALRGLPVSGRADRGDEQEFYGLHPWREGESQRRVAWKLSARRGRLLVREFRGEARPPVHVVLSTGVRGVHRAAGGRRSFDTAVSVAATLVEHFLRRRHPVRLTLLGATPRAIACARGRRGLFPTLAELAEVRSESHRRVVRPTLHLARSARRGEATMVVKAGGMPDGRDAVRKAGRSAVVIDVDGAQLSQVYTSARALGHRALLGLAR